MWLIRISIFKMIKLEPKVQKPRGPKKHGSKIPRVQKLKGPKTQGSKPKRSKNPRVQTTPGNKKPKVPKTLGSKKPRVLKPKGPKNKVCFFDNFSAFLPVCILRPKLDQ